VDGAVLAWTGVEVCPELFNCCSICFNNTESGFTILSACENRFADNDVQNKIIIAVLVK
jgi:hypothetical protein